MKIVNAVLGRQSLALKTPFVTALRRVDSADFISLELITDNGLRAYGSAPATKAVTGETLESIERTLRHIIIPALMHRPFAPEQMLEDVRHCCSGSHSAKAAADMALHSLAAARQDVPLYRLLGAEHSTPLKTAVTVSLDTSRAMRTKAVEAYGSGMDILKIKVGGHDGQDPERVRAIASALPDATLLVDANQAWDVPETMVFIDAVSDLAIALIEQPVPAHDLEGLAEITSRSPFPILADEAVFTSDDAEKVLDRHAADLINIKLMKCGGIAEAQKIIAMCRRYDTRCMLGSMLEGPVSITAALHLANAHPDIFAWIDLDSPLLYRQCPTDLPFSVTKNRYAL